MSYRVRFGHTEPVGPHTVNVPPVTFNLSAEDVTAENQQSNAPPVVEAQNSSLNTNSNTTSFTIDLPAGIQANDLLIAIIGDDHISRTFNWPAGWTAMVGGNNNDVVGIYPAYRYADGGEGSTITVTTDTATGRNAHQTYRISNAKDPAETAPFVSYAQGATDAPNPPINNPPGGEDAYLFIAAAAVDRETGTGYDVSLGPSGYSGFTYNETGDNTWHAGLATAYRSLTATSSENPGTFTGSALEEWSAVTIGVYPAGAGTVPTPNQVAVPVVDFIASPVPVQASQVGGGGGANPYFECDCSTFSNDASLHAVMGTTTTGNVHAEPGTGMRYDYQAFPTRCGDQTLSSIIPLPANTTEVWLSLRIKFSSNWTLINPNCTSPAPDFKTILFWLNNRAALQGGHERWGFHIGNGETRVLGHVPGYPQLDDVPINVARVETKYGLNATDFFDNQWHTVDIYCSQSGDSTATIRSKLDGQVWHNYQTGTATGLSGNWIKEIVVGANRNLGATSLMHIWWDDIKVWTSDPGNMTWPALDVY
jgi:hypothetical protein